MIFKIKKSDLGVKHTILEIYGEQYLESSSPNDESTFALHFYFIPNCISNKKLKYQVRRCLMSLCVSGHFDLIKKDSDNYIAISKKGQDALNSEEFAMLEEEHRRKVINNRYTIAFGIITAFGVLWSLADGIIKRNEKPPIQELRVIIEQQAKTPPHRLDSSKAMNDTVLISSSRDSIKVFKIK